MALRPWTYQGSDFNLPEGASPDNIQGFVYTLTSRVTGMIYVGKKFFWSAKSKQVKGRKKRFKVESDWKEYCGSSEAVRRDVELNGEDSIDREIIHLCATKAECTYWETYEIFSRHCLLRPDLYLNEWVSGRVRRAHLKGLIAVHASR